MHRDDFTPSTWYNEELNVENTVLPNIPEFDSSAGILMYDLSFLDQDDRTTIGTRGGTTEFDTLLSRTRVVVQFLQGMSADTENKLSKSSEVSGLGAMSTETDFDPSNIDKILAQSQNSSLRGKQH
ncbi:hypothetical protein FXO37_29845 [Capsicum annuum]|nr:hypothetical protein FXO37_29845 [Capsicum annuum]